MVERRQVREEAASATTAEESFEQERTLDSLPNGMPALKTIDDGLAAELLDMAERHVAEARRRLGKEALKPRLKRVEALFLKHAKTPPSVVSDLASLMKAAGMIPQLANYDAKFDQVAATAYYNFDRTSAHVGAAIQNAYDGWTLEVRLYRSDARTAGAILNAAIEVAGHQDEQVYEDPSRTKPQVDYYRRSTKIAEAILAYEESMRQSGSKLTAAFSDLMSGLVEASNDLAVAEAAMIATLQIAYGQFWARVQNTGGVQARF